MIFDFRLKDPHGHRCRWSLVKHIRGAARIAAEAFQSAIENQKSKMHYAELHTRTNFSFLEGASHPDEMVARAVELGYSALAITDRNSLAGVVRAHIAAKEAGMKLIIGALITPRDAPAVVVWATDRAAYGRLTRLITRGRRRAEKGECELVLADVAEYAEGLLAGVTVDPDPYDDAMLLSKLATYRNLFSDRGYLLAELHRGPDDRQRLEQWERLSRKVGLPLVAAGNVHYHVARRKVLHDVLTAIRNGSPVPQVGEHLSPNAQRHLKPLDEIATTFSRNPDAIRRTIQIAERCRFSLDELRYEYPEEMAPPGEKPHQYLQRLAWEGASQRYPDGIPTKVRRLLDHELKLIEELHYEAYFLTVWDLVRFARSRGILCQGRGSAANSAVCFCLGVTSVDPESMDVLFERFVNRERNEAPDIDVDFEHERREEVLQYVYEKYGRERAGITAEVITYRPRSAVRDVGKALGLSLDRVDALAKNLEGYSKEPNMDHRCRMSGIDPDSDVGRRLIHTVEEILGFPRHLSQHVGGMVITRGPLCELVPIENAAMAGRTVIEWDKDDLDELGILKVDCLALGMLTAIRKCFALIRQRTGLRLTLASVPPGNSDVYDMICRADTMGVFQIESRAQMSMLPRLRPRCFYDLVIEVAIVRPGPIQGNMVHPYLRRRNGEEVVSYPNEAIREVLDKTLGVPIFQEQAMRLAVVAAGFTPGEADQLRRAMGAWRRPGIIDQFHKKLIDGMLENGLTREFAEHVFSQIRGFGEYGFPESHSASFALLVYVSAWLKYHEPAAFTAALLNSQPMGFYAPAQLVRCAKEHGVQVQGVDVNYSEWDCTEEGASDKGSLRRKSKIKSQKSKIRLSKIRLGFRMIVGMSQTHAHKIQRARHNGPFLSVDDLVHRTGLSRKVLERLAGADAFRSLGLNRRQALWQVLDQENHPQPMPLFGEVESGEWEVGSGEMKNQKSKINSQESNWQKSLLPELSEQEEVYADYQTVGLSLRRHPVSFYRSDLDAMGIVPAQELKKWPHNRPVKVAGLVLMRQRPSTARGITFVTLEDETGIANLIIRQAVWERHYPVARRASAMIADGRLERKRDVIHIVVNRLEDLTDQLEKLRNRSRDFR